MRQIMTRTFNPAVDEPKLATVPEMKGFELSLNEMTPLDPKDLEVVAGGMVILNEISIYGMGQI
jgi:hypothetical protein